MQIYVLASGSKGNLTIINDEKSFYMIDCGISLRKIKQKLDEKNIDISSINKLLITHEHHDHIMGLNMLLKLGYIKDIYLTKGTLDALDNIISNYENININIIKEDLEFKIGNLNILPIMLSHDANEPVGFVFEKTGKKFVLLTDTGYIHESYFDLLKGADLYMLEANHDPNMLMKSKRPFLLKKRIMGLHGHLSNDDACIAMNHFIKDIDKTIWVVSHISDDCNTQLSIERQIVKFVDDPTKIDVLYSSQESLAVIKV